MAALSWDECFDAREYQVVAFGRDWWDAVTQAADRLGVPQESRRTNAPTGYKILRKESPQIYADNTEKQHWITFNVDAHRASLYRDHPYRPPGGRHVLLWRRGHADGQAP